jgi:hypothetical protein
MRFARERRGSPSCGDHRNLTPDQVSGERGQSVGGFDVRSVSWCPHHRARDDGLRDHLMAVASFASATAETKKLERDDDSKKSHHALAAEELVENAAAIGPEHQHHTRQRASGHHTRRHRQGELFGELRFASLDHKRK